MKAFILAVALGIPYTLADDIRLFDGKTLDGWYGDTKFWKIEDGAITGECTKANPCTKTTYLRFTKQKVSNFELTLKYRFLSEKGNSGIQYRSQFSPDNFTISGYQADIETGKNHSGILYDQGGRGIVAKRGLKVSISSKGKKSSTPLASGELAQQSIKKGEWNSYKIIADGNTLTHIINGHKTIEVIDNDPKHADVSGCIALQLHQGPPMKVQFKNINLLELDHKTALPQPKWIWASETKGKQRVTFTNSFNIKAKRFFAVPEFIFTADDTAELYVNDKKAATITDSKEPLIVDIARFLENGENIIRVEVTNNNGPAGFVAQFGKVLMSDESWKVQTGQSATQTATVIALHGDEPWGNILKNAKHQSIEINTLPGFSAKTLYEVPSSQGSWVSIAFGPKGNLYCCDQYGDLYKVTLTDGRVTNVKPIKSPGKAQGLCFAYGSLYMSKSTGDGGIFRLTDTTGDGKFDKQEHIIKLTAGSEHGGHSIIKSEKGGLYFIAGNYTTLPKNVSSFTNNNWKEDLLLKRLTDPRGHARKVRAPGGYIVHLEKDGSNPRVISSGHRNPYGLALSPTGSLFTYDADMEWDAGTPWYRPTRVLHLTEGSEFGWRTGTGKWPTYFPDNLPSMINMGPGSPTGALFGTGAKFPGKYRDALYVLDWTFGRIYALHLKPTGSTYSATKEVFVSGKPLPVCAATIGPDGAMYFVSGGRRLGSKLIRVSYEGKIDNAPSEHKAPPLSPILESLTTKPSVAEAWEHLDNQDHRVAFTARMALETLPLESWITEFKKETLPAKTIQASIALARKEKHGELILSKLNSIDFSSLTEKQKLFYLRALSLCYIRTKISILTADSKQISKKLDSHFPSSSYNLNVELARLLTKLEEPSSLAKTLKLMEEATPEKQTLDTNLLSSNERYGKTFKEMMKNQPNSKSTQFALILMSARKGWNKETVTRYFTKLNKEEVKQGGASYKGFIANIKKELMSSLPEDLQKVAHAAPKPKTKQAEVFVAKGPGRNWSMDEALKATANLKKANYENGKRMYQAVICSQCHIHGTIGGDSGPNLTNLSTRFSKKDILKAIIQPSEEISEQYHFDEMTLHNGTVIIGKITKKTDKLITYAPSAFQLAATTTIQTSKVKSIQPSKISPMPASLINSLNSNELRDLMKFLTNQK